VYRGKNILPSQNPILGSRLRLYAYATACLAYLFPKVKDVIPCIFLKTLQIK
jgi:hypothetical protein